MSGYGPASRYRLQVHVHVNVGERADDPTVRRGLDQAKLTQNLHVLVNALDVARHAAPKLTDADRTAMGSRPWGQVLT